MSFASKAGFAGRLLGIVVAVCVAGELAWAGVERDAATGQASWQTKNITKQAYRTHPGILTCRTTMSLLNEFYPQQTTIVHIPAPQDRGADFDLAALDNAVDSDDCTLDTSPQDIATAMRPATQVPKSYADSSTQRALTNVPRVPTRRHGFEKS